MHHHHHRPMAITGYITGLAALLLLAWLVWHHAIPAHGPMTARVAVLATADIMLGMASLVLLTQSARSGHVDGVREAVERVYAEGYTDGLTRRTVAS
ncbi:hypothetical protein AB0875_12395 [Micromonospora gifhornensis]|uniref:hypothetical protein n=1 Tax=Micromonospora gifhornensis TaxID=84594 RepID=UPI00345411C1